jgi:Fe-S oxidoreductase
MMFRDEFKKFAQALNGKVLTVAELFNQYLKELDTHKLSPTTTQKHRLLPHCSEQALLPSEGRHWQAIFATLGAELEVVNSGCCGMAGTYGHLVEQQGNSAELFKQHWHKNATTDGVVVLASGFSCRSQTAKQISKVLPHPIEVVNQLI